MQQRMTSAHARAALDRVGRHTLGMCMCGAPEPAILQPRGTDPPPHRRDDLCAGTVGRGYFACGGICQACGPGEVRIAPAGTPHRIEDFGRDVSACGCFTVAGAVRRRSTGATLLKCMSLVARSRYTSQPPTRTVLT